MTKKPSQQDRAWDDLLKCAEKYARVLSKSEKEWIKDAKSNLNSAIAGLKKLIGATPLKKGKKKKISKSRRKYS